MCVYLRGKFEVSSITLTSFGQGVGNFTPSPPPQNEHLKIPPRLGLKEQPLKDHPFGTYTKFTEKLTFLTHL